MGQQLAPAQIIELVKEQESRFKELDSANGTLLNFDQECLFARQQLLKNNFTLKVAAGNPTSLKGAILNIAAIGLSLNPATQHAYLVPRDGAICLDISFQGLKKLATDSGSIRWAKCELVYEKDSFEWCGPAAAPIHKADPFSDRGPIKGGYCIAKLPDGETLTEVMSVDEINKIRDSSKAFKSNTGPWVNWYDEMAKKTILKRAYKQWPQTPNRERLDAAVMVSHQAEGIAYTIEQHAEFMSALQNEDALGMYLFRMRTEDTAYIALYNSFEKGQKVANKQKAAELDRAGLDKAMEIVADLEAAIDSEDTHGAFEVIESFSDQDFKVIEALLSQEHKYKLTEMNLQGAA